MSGKYDFNNKIVIVTGSAQGIGKAVAKKFGESGAKIVINDINKNCEFKRNISIFSSSSSNYAGQ